MRDVFTDGGKVALGLVRLAGQQFSRILAAGLAGAGPLAAAADTRCAAIARPLIYIDIYGRPGRLAA